MPKNIKYSDLFEDDGGIDKLIQKIKELETTYAKIGKASVKQLNAVKRATENLKTTDKDFNNQIKANEKQVDAVVKKMKEQEKEEKKLNNLRKKAIRLKTDEAKTEQALKIQIQEGTRALKNEIIAEKQQKGSLKQLEAQLRRNIEKYRSLSRAERDNTKAGKDLLRNIKQQDIEVKKLNGSIGRSQGNVGNYGAAFKSLGGLLGKGLGLLGITAGIAGLARVMMNAVGVFSGYEKQNSKLQAVLGVTKDEMDELTVSSKLLGATTAFTASQVAGLQTEFAKLGFPTSDILAMTESTLNAAAAMDADLGEAAKLTGAIMKSFKLEASEAGRVNDVLAKSTSASALDFAKLSSSMSTIAPVAAKFGFSLEGTTALLGQLSNAGFDASSAATATRKILLNLVDTNGKLAKSLKEPVKDLPSLVRGLEQLKSEGVDLGAALELTDVKSVAAFTTFLEGTDSLSKLNDALLNAEGTAKKMADTMLDNLAGSVTILGSAWEGFILGIEDGNGVIGGFLRGAVDTATALLGLITTTEDATEATYESAIANRDLANSSQLLLDEYESLVKDGIEPTVEEKQKLDEITLQLKDSLGDSVVAIDEETGALTLNTTAVREQIKIKRLASDEEATKLLSRLVGAKEEIKVLEQKRRIDANIEKTRLEAVKRLEKERSKTSSSRTRRRETEEEAKAAKAARLSGIQVGKTSDLLAEQIEKRDELIAQLKELNFTEKDAAVLFPEQIKNLEEGNAGNKIKVGLLNDIAAIEKILKEEQLSTNDPERILVINDLLEEQKKKREDLLGLTALELLKLEEEALEALIELDLKRQEQRLKGNEKLQEETLKLQQEGIVNEIESEKDKALKIQEFKEKNRLEQLKKEAGDFQEKEDLETEIKIQGERDRANIEEKFAAKEKKEQDKKDKKTKAENKKSQDAVVNASLDALDRIQNEEQRRLDDKIKATDDQITRQEDLAKEGLENTLAFEEGERAKFELKKIESEKKAIRLEKVKALYAAYSAAASSGDDNAIVTVLRDFAIIQGLESSLQSFGDGTGEYGDVGDALDARKGGSKGGNSLMNGIFKGTKHNSKGGGGIPVLVEGDEGIWKGSTMGKFGKDNFIKLTQGIDSGNIGSDIFERQVAVIPQQSTMIGMNFDSLESTMSDVKRAIEMKPVPNLHAESISQMVSDIVHTVKAGKKTITSRYRINKRGL